MRGFVLGVEEAADKVEIGSYNSSNRMFEKGGGGSDDGGGAPLELRGLTAEGCWLLRLKWDSGQRRKWVWVAIAS
ncbi:hypothetical protein Ancab_005731 [Ancistrocladus abbreviatus]